MAEVQNCKWVTIKNYEEFEVVLKDVFQEEEDFHKKSRLRFPTLIPIKDFTYGVSYPLTWWDEWDWPCQLFFYPFSEFTQVDGGLFLTITVAVIPAP